MPWPTVHPTATFKTYRDAPNLCFSTEWTDAWKLTQRFIWWLCSNILYCPEWVLFSTGWSDGASLDSIGALYGFPGSTAILKSVSDRMIRRLHRRIPSVLLFQETFSTLTSLARPINMTPLPLLSCLCHSEDLLQLRREGECVLAIWDSLPLHWGALLSDQECSRCIHGLAECSGQVEVCGLVTLGVWRLLDSLGALGVLDELLEIVGASRKAWYTRFETHRSGDGERVLLVSTCVLVTQGGAIL
jgi:hypothetical protein